MNRQTARPLAVAGVLLLVVALPSAAEAATGQVITSGTTLTVRSGPSTSAAAIGSLAPGTIVSFSCYVQGDAVNGPYGTETIWDRLDTGGYVSDAWVYTNSNQAVVPLCASTSPPAPAAGQYKIAWTGIGVYPRAGTSMGSAHVGAALPDGATVTLVCETTGDTVTDSAGYVSNLWDQISIGGYVSNAYIDTGVNGPTPGVPACSSAPTPTPPSNAPYSCEGPTDATSDYDGWSACEWAVHNAYETPRFTDDCTWFVSQALWWGGLPQSSAWTSASWDLRQLAVKNPFSSKGPFALPGPTVDAARAASLVDYLVANHLATRKAINWADNTAGGAQIGDIIAYYWNQGEAAGTIDHLSLVTGFSGSYPLVSQHTPGQLNRGWSWSLLKNNWIQYSSDIPNPVAYLIHITG